MDQEGSRRSAKAPTTEFLKPMNPPSPSDTSISGTTSRARLFSNESVDSMIEKTPATASTITEQPSVALANLRVLLHPGLRIGGSLPSSITPPLAALEHLFSYLHSSKYLGHLSSADWNAFVSWLVYYQDNMTLSRIHQIIMKQKKIAANINPSDIVTISEGRVRNILGSDCFSPSSLSIRTRLEQKGDKSTTTTDHPSSSTALDILQDTVTMMKACNIPRSKELYTLYLRTAVLEQRWLMGTTIWDTVNQPKEQKYLGPPSVAFLAQIVRCHMQIGNGSAASEFLRSIFDQTHWTDINSSGGVSDGRLTQTGAGNDGQGKADTEQTLNIVENRATYLKQKQSQANRAVQVLQKAHIAIASSESKSKTASNAQSHSWKAEVYPSLIEAICLGEKDQSGASLAVDLAGELLQHGYLLDKTRFSLLVQYIGSISSSEQAENFMKDWVDAVKAVPLSLPSAGGANRDAINDSESRSDLGSSAGSGSEASKDLLRKHKRTAKVFAEVGYLEVVKQATAMGDYTRAFTIFQEMSSQGFPLQPDISNKLLIGLAKMGDLPSATTVLNVGLQYKWIPSIEAANILLQRLIKADWLDESVSIFRDLTENYGIRPSTESYRHLLHLTSSYGQLAMTERLVKTLGSLGLEHDGLVHRDLIKCHVRSENMAGAIQAFEEMDSADVTITIQHINVLLEGAIRQSIPSTAIRILEIMSSLKIQPDAETWNILLGGAFTAGDNILAHALFQELGQTLVKRAYVKTDGIFRASRHPVTFNLLINEYADRHGVGSALKLLKEAIDARYPAQVTQNVFRDLLEKSKQQGNGRAGYQAYKLLREWDQQSNPLTASQRGRDNSNSRPSTTKNRSTGTDAPISTGLRPLSAFPTTSTSKSVRAPSLGMLYCGVMEQLEKENRFELGKEMATDLIVSGVGLDQSLVEHAIRLYARSGELAAAFGLFMKMGRAYGVEPSKDMVLSLVDVARAYQLIPRISWEEDDLSNRFNSYRSVDSWDHASIQQWTKILRKSMSHFGIQ
ncbi:hypothetical protein FBU30_004183 [Linnemannia zychae]|nr:hypothetical protein FBU30_004183 [Linnemannia zychae]